MQERGPQLRHSGVVEHVLVLLQLFRRRMRPPGATAKPTGLALAAHPAAAICSRCRGASRDAAAALGPALPRLRTRCGRRGLRGRHLGQHRRHGPRQGLVAPAVAGLGAHVRRRRGGRSRQARRGPPVQRGAHEERTCGAAFHLVSLGVFNFDAEATGNTQSKDIIVNRDGVLAFHRISLLSSCRFVNGDYIRVQRSLCPE
mmetsp:Transcript_2742/g.8181  ORF Transcript_2742/g.8181 Transcript_2742/m.8181 type:complete len:201 (+) Transcript_2742:2181-2783(+)